MASPSSTENESDYSPISGAIDESSGNPPVGALYSGSKSAFVVYIFEKDRVEPWLVMRAMQCEVRIYRHKGDISHDLLTFNLNIG